MADTLLTHNTGKLYTAAALIAAIAANALVKLIKADFTQNATLVYADLTFANFSGYANWAPTFAAASIVSGVAVSNGSTHDFAHDGGGVANTIYGAALVDSTGPTLIATIKFDTPKAMAASGDVLHAAALLRLLTE